MGKLKLVVLTGALLAGLILAGVTDAMSSPRYTLNWFTLSATSGTASSAETRLSYSVGQTVVGVSADSDQRSCFGIWCGLVDQLRLYLPLLERGFAR